MHTDETPYSNLAEHCVDIDVDENGDDHDDDDVMTKILQSSLTMHTDVTPSIYQPCRVSIVLGGVLTLMLMILNRPMTLCNGANGNVHACIYKVFGAFLFSI